MSGTGEFELRDRSNAFKNDRRLPLTARANFNDDEDLRRLGKNPVLKRNFGFMTILGFSCTVLITWEGFLIVSTQSLLNGGPAGVIWGFLVIWTGTGSTFATIAELASMAPTAGGQYHWVAMLAPASTRSFLAFATGWTTIAGWQAVTASAGYLVGSLIQGMIALARPSYDPKPWQAMMFFWAVILFAVFINTITSHALARFEGMILILHLFGFFAVLIPLVYFGPHGDSTIFTQFRNGGDWPSQPLSFFVGLPASVFCLIGADSAVHMSEEIQRASIFVPQALMLSILINGVLGFAMAIALMFCIGDVEAAIAAEQSLGYAFLEIFLQAVNSVAGACLMASLVVVMGICSVVGCFAASSRMLWSFSRDHGTPYWKQLIQLDPRTSIPVYTIVVTTAVSMLLSLIVLGSSVAFANIVSLSVAGLYSSYLLACVLLLWRRLTSGIGSREDHDSARASGRLRWGPWRIPEPFGTVNNIFACLYLITLLFWSFWPPAIPVTASNMNFSSLVFGTIVAFSILWYFATGRKNYTGPIIETDI